MARMGSMTKANDEIVAEVVLCVGPPKCNLRGNMATKAAEAGCKLCRHVYFRKDGSEVKLN
jgi:hypothetical protein